MTNIADVLFDLDSYDKKCVARIREKKRHKTRFSFSVDPWVLSDFKETFDIKGDDWNDWIDQKMKERIQEDGPGVIAKRMKAEILEREEKISLVEKMNEVKADAPLKAVNKFFLEELDRIRRVDRNGMVRDWRVPELESIVRTAMKRFKISMGDVTKSIGELTRHYDDQEKEKRDEALANVAAALEDEKNNQGLSERDRQVLEASRGLR